MDLDDELSDEERRIELANISEVKARLETAINSEAKSFHKEYGFENFRDRRLNSSEESICGLRNSPRYELFFYLTGRQNTMDNNDIDLYIADTLYNYAYSVVVDLSHVGPEGFTSLDRKAIEFGENAVSEAESILLKSSPKNDFGKAYKNYSLGVIEVYRAEILVGDEGSKEEITDHLMKGIKFLEESVYQNDTITYAKHKLYHSYNCIASLDICSREIDNIRKKLRKFNQKYPEIRKEDLRYLAEVDQKVEEARHSKKV